ncbi:flagellar hook-length control protein FliK [Methylobacillus flagellatus]|uniref:flagellar hook-length control protein FliK n=1 Tax=Methylobacillus flagellatus TaxID=405 RepID=UPI001484CD18|nr:flagellar hook-length control protein FliK [Methylobacillus flagellatus]
MMMNPTSPAASNAANSQPKPTATEIKASEANIPPFQQVLAAHTRTAEAEPPSPAMSGNPRLKASGAQGKPVSQPALSDKPLNRQAVSTDKVASTDKSISTDQPTKTETVNPAQAGTGNNKLAGAALERQESSEAARESLQALNEWLGIPVAAGAAAEIVTGTVANTPAAPAVSIAPVPDRNIAGPSAAETSAAESNTTESSTTESSTTAISTAQFSTTRSGVPVADRLATQRTELKQEPTAGKSAYQALADDTVADTLQQARSAPLLQEAPGRFQLGAGQPDAALAAVRPDTPSSTAPHEALAESNQMTESRPIAFTPSPQASTTPATPTITAANTAASLLPPMPYIESYPGRSGWNQAISQQVLWMVGALEQTATLTLNPPDLGPLQIVIQVSNEQASASFSSEHQEVRQALQDGMEHLRERMKEAGVTLGETSVGSGQAQPQAQRDGAQATRHAPGHAGQDSGTTLQAPSSANPRTAQQQGLVDLYA